MSLTTTTQKPQSAHVRYLITATMLATADKRYDDAAIEPDNPGYVSNERPSHYALEYHVGQGLVVAIGQCPWFFHTVIPWATLFWLFFRKHLFRANEVYLLAGDEVVVSKALDFRQHNPDSGIIDLKAYYRSFRYVREMLKMLPEIPEPI